MENKYNKIYLLIHFLNVLNLSVAENCLEDPVILDEQFVSCCRGRPRYTSEPCIDALLANETFSPECLLNCMYKEFEMYDDNVIDLTAVKSFLDAQIVDEDFNLMYMNAFERCSKMDKDTIAETFQFVELTNEFNCDVYPQYIDMCVWYHTLANCPDSYATNDDDCNNKREWVNECLLK